MNLPSLPDSFHWTQESWGAALRCRALDAVAPHLFSTRQLQATSHGFRELAAAVGARDVVTVAQVHGPDVAVVHLGTPRSDSRPQADALVSNDPSAAIAVRAADCVPLLMADRTRGVVAAVHAGWRGTAARAAVAALDALSREFNTRSADVIVAIGPAIGACCYAVGPDLVDAFAAAGHERYLIDRWFAAPPEARGVFRSPAGSAQLTFDVVGANRDQLMIAGVPAEQIHVAGLCTAMHLEVLTSYRAEKEAAGRILGAIRVAG
jgi:YfiH family protein